MRTGRRNLWKGGIMEYWKDGERSGEEWKYGILEGWVVKCGVQTQNSIVPIFQHSNISSFHHSNVPLFHLSPFLGPGPKYRGSKELLSYGLL